MIRSASQTLGEAPQTPGATLADFVFITQANGATYTLGATAIIPVTLHGPKISQKWSIISVTINGYLTIRYTGTMSPIFGRLGKIVAMLNPHENIAAYNGTFIPLFSDETLATDIWNPEVNSVPPISQYTFKSEGPPPNQLLPISGVIVPPNPISLDEGIEPSIGIWMYPSIVGVVGSATGTTPYIQITYGSYNILYNDGL